MTITKWTGLVHTILIHDKEDYSVDFQHNLLMIFSLDEDDIFTDVSDTKLQRLYLQKKLLW